MTATGSTIAIDPARLGPVLDVAHLGHAAIFSIEHKEAFHRVVGDFLTHSQAAS